MQVLGNLNIGDIFELSGFQWLVVTKNHVGFPDNTVTVMSTNILVQKAFDVSNINHWGSSSLRKYLNGEFYTMLDDDFKLAIKETKLVNKDTNGNEYFTDDKVFIPSLQELGFENNIYTSVGANFGSFNSNESRIAKFNDDNWYYCPSLASIGVRIVINLSCNLKVN